MLDEGSPGKKGGYSIKQWQSAAKKMSKEKKSLMKEKTELLKRIKNSQKEVESLESKLEAKDEVVQGLMATNEALEKSKKVLKAELAMLKSTNDEFVKNEKSFKRMLAQRQNENNRLKSSLNESKKLLEQFKCREGLDKNYKSECEGLNTDLSSVNANLKLAYKKIAMLEDKLKRKNHQIQESQSKIEKQLVEISSISMKCDSKEIENSRLQAEKITQSNNIAKLENKVDLKDKEIESIKGRVEQLSTSIKHHSKVQSELARVKIEKKKTVQQLENLKRQNSNLKLKVEGFVHEQVKPSTTTANAPKDEEKRKRKSKRKKRNKKIQKSTEQGKSISVDHEIPTLPFSSEKRRVTHEAKAPEFNLQNGIGIVDILSDDIFWQVIKSEMEKGQTDVDISQLCRQLQYPENELKKLVSVVHQIRDSKLEVKSLEAQVARLSSLNSGSHYHKLNEALTNSKQKAEVSSKQLLAKQSQLIQLWMEFERIVPKTLSGNIPEKLLLKDTLASQIAIKDQEIERLRMKLDELMQEKCSKLRNWELVRQRGLTQNGPKCEVKEESWKGDTMGWESSNKLKSGTNSEVFDSRHESQSQRKKQIKNLSEQVKVADLELLSLAEHVRKNRNTTKPLAFVKAREKKFESVEAAKIDDLQTTLTLEREEVKRLKERLDESKSETMEILDSLQTELSKSKTEVSRLTNELLECYNHINEFAEEMSKAVPISLRKKLGKGKEEGIRIDSRNRLPTKFKLFHESVQLVKSSLVLVLKERDEQQKDLCEAKRRLDETREKLSGQNDARASNNEKNLQELRNSLNLIEEQKSVSDNEVSRLSAIVEGKEKEALQERRKVKHLEAEIKKLTISLSSNKKEQGEVRAQIVETKRYAKDLEEKYRIAKQKLEDLSKDYVSNEEMVLNESRRQEELLKKKREEILRETKKLANVISEISDLTNFVTKNLDVEAMADKQLVKLKEEEKSSQSEVSILTKLTKKLVEQHAREIKSINWKELSRSEEHSVELSAAKKEAANLSIQLQKKERECAEAVKKHDVTQRELRASKESATGFQDKLMVLRAKTDKLQFELSEKTKYLSQYKSNAETKSNNLKNELKTAHEITNELRKKLSSSNERNQKLASELKKTTNDFELESVKLAKANRRVGELESEAIRSRGTEKKTLEKHRAALVNQEKQVKAKATKAMKKKLNQFKETTRVETKSLKENYEKKVSSILETLKKREDEIKELKAKIEGYSRDQKKVNQYNALQSEKTKIEEQLKQRSIEHQESLKNLNQIKKETEKYRVKLQDSEEERRKLSEKTLALANSHEDSQKGLRNQLDSVLRKQALKKEEFDRELKVLNAKQSDLTSELKAKDTKLKKFGQIIRKFQSSTKAKDEMIAKLEETVKQYQSGSADLNLEITKISTSWVKYLQSTGSKISNRNPSGGCDGTNQGFDKDGRVDHIEIVLERAKDLSLQFSTAIGYLREQALVLKRFDERERFISDLETRLEEAGKDVEKRKHSHSEQSNKIADLSEKLKIVRSTVRDRWDPDLKIEDYSSLTVEARVKLREESWCFITWCPSGETPENPEDRTNSSSEDVSESKCFWTLQKTFLKRLDLGEEDYNFPQFISQLAVKNLKQKFDAKWSENSRRFDEEISRLEKLIKTAETESDTVKTQYKEYKKRAHIILENKTREIKEMRSLVQENEQYKEKVKNLQDHVRKLDAQHPDKLIKSLTMQLEEQTEKSQKLSQKNSLLSSKLSSSIKQVEVQREDFSNQIATKDETHQIELKKLHTKYLADQIKSRKKFQTLLLEQEKKFKLQGSRRASDSLPADSILSYGKDSPQSKNLPGECPYVEQQTTSPQASREKSVSIPDGESLNSGFLSQVNLDALKGPISQNQPRDEETSPKTPSAKLMTIDDLGLDQLAVYQSRIRKLQTMVAAQDSTRRDNEYKIEYLTRKMKEMERIGNIQKYQEEMNYVKESIYKYLTAQLDGKDFLPILKLAFKYSSEEVESIEKKLVPKSTFGFGYF